MLSCVKIAAITRFKHGSLYQLLKKHGWTQIELSRRSGINQSDIGRIVNLHIRPTDDRINKIQKAFAEVGEFIDVLALFPKNYEGAGKSIVFEQIKDVEPELIADAVRNTLDYHNVKSSEILHDGLQKALLQIDEIERIVINERFIQNRTLQDIANDHNFSLERVRQIQNNGLKHLRQPYNMRLIKGDELDKTDTSLGYKFGKIPITNGSAFNQMLYRKYRINKYIKGGFLESAYNLAQKWGMEDYYNRKVKELPIEVKEKFLAS